MSSEMDFHVIDATLSIEEQQQQMRGIVVDNIGDALRNDILRVPLAMPHEFPHAAPVL
jgi:hypothetical protein